MNEQSEAARMNGTNQSAGWKLQLAYIEAAIAGILIGLGLVQYAGVAGVPLAIAFGAWHVWSAKVLSDHDASNAEGQGCRASRHTLDPLVGSFGGAE